MNGYLRVHRMVGGWRSLFVFNYIAQTDVGKDFYVHKIEDFGDVVGGIWQSADERFGAAGAGRRGTLGALGAWLAARNRPRGVLAACSAWERRGLGDVETEDTGERVGYEGRVQEESKARGAARG